MISVLVDSQMHEKKEVEIEAVRLIGSDRTIPDTVLELLEIMRMSQFLNCGSEEKMSKSKSNISKQKMIVVQSPALVK